MNSIKSEEVPNKQEASALRKQDFLTVLGLLSALGTTTAPELVFESGRRAGGLHSVALSSAYRHLNQMISLGLVNGRTPDPEQWNRVGRPQTLYELTERGEHLLDAWNRSRERLFAKSGPTTGADSNLDKQVS